MRWRDRPRNIVNPSAIHGVQGCAGRECQQHMSDAGVACVPQLPRSTLPMCGGFPKILENEPGNPDRVPNENTEEKNSGKRFISWCGCSSKHVRGVELCHAENTDCGSASNAHVKCPRQYSSVLRVVNRQHGLLARLDAIMKEERFCRLSK
ncbi:hypothetical protein BJX68DRAFT_2027 [Aspergillus pseudodeflectus]|uniref:Uncharacterized protein n=1 Tax=Aspergillus pseudodeflectus TaxID=176178 RepID=A0ABR4L9W3_9EURO